MEILVVWYLCKKNIGDERVRGRSGSAAPLYTILIWFFGEFLGFIIGGSICRILGWPFKLTYLWIFAFAFTLLLSLVTRAIAKR